RPGGTEAYALDLYETLRESSDFEPILIARAGSETTGNPTPQDVFFETVDGDPNQYFLFTDRDSFDPFLMTFPDKRIYDSFGTFLRAHEPDLVHFQHSLWVGYDAITQTRSVLGEVPIVYTLHEFLPICHRDGQMVRTVHEELCDHASPRRCNECFP